MDIKTANELFKNGKYEDAENLYAELYARNELSIYKIGWEMARKKQGKSLEEKNLFNESKTLTTLKKILFITAGLKGPTAGGGIATCFHSMIKTMGTKSDREIDVLYIAHPYYSNGNYEKWQKIYKEECNANLIVIGVNDKHYGSKEMKRSYAILQFLTQKQHLYETAIFHDIMGLAYFPLLAQKTGLSLSHLRIIISAHGNNKLSNFFGQKKIKHWDEKVILFMEKKSYQYAQEITTPSQYYKEWLTDQFQLEPQKITVIPNIVFQNPACGSRLNFKFSDSNKQLIVFYGRMERLKGIDLLINSIIESNKENIVYNILFAGTSSKIDNVTSQEYIQNLLKDLPCEVQFTFNCNASEVFNYVKNNNGICVFPTLGETSSCVVVESILHETPFIASALPGIQELIAPEHRHSHLFKTGNISDFLNKLQQPFVQPTIATLAYNALENESKWIDFLSHNHKNFNNIKLSQPDLPLVSVVIPTSDRTEQLKESIESIVKQSYKNIEIIIVDDASRNPNPNKMLADQFSARYILLPEKKYKGAACNIGVEHANGDYICFFDDDDIANFNMIQRYITAFQLNEEIDILSGFTDCFEHQNYIDTRSINVEYTSLALGGGLEVNLHINFFGKGTFIIKTDKFKKIGGYEEDQDAVPMVDYRFYMKSALNHLGISIIPEALYFYRKNSPNSLFYVNKNKRHLQYLAKHSMQGIFEDNLGNDIGSSVSAMIWDVGLPKFE